jgi:hypothetical protein
MQKEIIGKNLASITDIVKGDDGFFLFFQIFGPVQCALLADNCERNTMLSDVFHTNSEVALETRIVPFT